MTCFRAELLLPKEVTVVARKFARSQDSTASGRSSRAAEALWIVYSVVGWATVYLLYLSGSMHFRLGL
ncbi:MAG: hypothetical protein ACHQF3_06630 [Alphaproteobacteria bacterium]